MKKGLIVVILLVATVLARAQNKASFLVRDSINGEKLAGVSVIVRGTEGGSTTDSSGSVTLLKLPSGKVDIQFSMIGYKTKTIALTLPTGTEPVTIVLERAEEEKMEEVIVSSSRTESRIEDLPTKVEVLGAEEVNEEAGIKPGNIASLLGDIAGIQTQQTSAATGNTEMRVQGLPGKYTQILRDGVPLFGGYSGSFSILQIPPLDLKQIEIVKGASSTLYGGGAIAGMINLVSKKPREGVFEKTLLLNQSSLKESNANLYLSNRKGKFGFTLFTGLTYQQPVDVNKDGFSDVPKTRSYFIHPTFFYYPDKKNSVSLGYNGVFENREGGDMTVIKNQPIGDHQYFDQNISYRNTVDAVWDSRINTKDRFTLKATGSWLDRQIATNTLGMRANQLSYYSEANYLKRFAGNDLVIGLNLNGENFKKRLPDTTQINNYNQATIGLFVQDDWKLSSRFIVQAGFRLDHNNQYGNFPLPRLSLLYRINSYFTTRLGGGMGYKIPTVFSSDIDERDYGRVLPLGSVDAERSTGANWDVNFHRKIDNWDITVNQTFYITDIRKPLIQNINGAGEIYFNNASEPMRTSGSETYVQVRYDKLEVYLGYVYTMAKKLYDKNQPYLSLSARNKFASVVAYEFTEHFRAGLESAFTGRQYLDDGSRTPAYPFVAAMLRYDFKKVSFVLNCENLFDYRQTRKEEIVSGPLSDPIFRQLWAPIDGRVVNLSMRISM
jgi:outer membrane receptor for ferrienterochelin and colicin